MKSIRKSDNSINDYYIISNKKKISFGIKLLRFITRYLIPTIIIASIIIVIDAILLFNTNLNVLNRYLYIALILGISFVAIILCSIWFKIISKNEDDDI